MLPQILLKDIEYDCLILLTRALFGKTLSCFGADGFGQYGTDPFGRHYEVVGIELSTFQDEDENVFTTAKIKLRGYDSQVQGHVATDCNLKISINKHLIAEYINPDCWTWADLSLQTQDRFSIEIDVAKLIG